LSRAWGNRHNSPPACRKSAPGSGFIEGIQIQKIMGTSMKLTAHVEALSTGKQ
jgi:hypothetical protein